MPKRHEFVNRIFLFAFDVDELDAIPEAVPIFAHNEAGLYSFRDDDHFQIVPGGTARANAEAFLSREGIEEKPARILLLTNARCFGHLFNPISIWYCEREDGSPLAAIAEVGNTFGELKPFLVPFHNGAFRLRTPKHFTSPRIQPSISNLISVLTVPAIGSSSASTTIRAQIAP